MSWVRLLLTSVLLGVFTLSSSAGIFSKKKPKVKPEERVSELMLVVKTAKEEKKRAAAAAELRKFDVRLFPDIIPLLIDVLHTDASTSVRLEAVQSLSRIRPVSQEVGLALEEAAGKDAALRVRLQARTSLMYYRLSGYHSPKKLDTGKGKKKGDDTKEPPLAGTSSTKKRIFNPFKSFTSKGVQTAGKKDDKTDNILSDNSVAKPLPVGPAKSPLVPTDAPKLKKPPTTKSDDGPSLMPN